MKTKYNDIVKIDKIIEIYNGIKKTTKHKNKLVTFEMNFITSIVKIYKDLKEKNYKHKHYNMFLIKSPKYRVVMSEGLYDKVVNHLMSKYILKKTSYPKLIEQNVATRENKGTSAALYYTKKYINKLKQNGEVYALKCDIKKFFYSIDHKILLKKLKKDINNDDIYNVLENIINSTDEEYINRTIELMVKNEKKNLIKNNKKLNKLKELESIPKYKKGVGLPIGNETSQTLAIYYLNSFDHYVKEKLKAKCYIRYMDDFIIFSNDKEYLKEILEKIKEYLETLNLELNRKTQIYNLKHRMTFLGYRFMLKGKKLIILINNDVKKTMKRKLKRLKIYDKEKYYRVKGSYKGYLDYASSGDLKYKLKFETKKQKKKRLEKKKKKHKKAHKKNDH